MRMLKTTDIKFMMEWMKDKDIIRYLNYSFSTSSFEDCVKFINNSININNMNFAIIDDKDEYMGTVSLKNINYDKKIAEMAIVLRKCAMGKGYAKNALIELFEYGRKELGLKKFYWYVKPNNIRALKFYDKNNYSRVDKIDELGDLDKQYIWYLVNPYIST